MLVIVFTAFGSTGFTGISTYATELTGSLTAQAHQLGGCVTDRGAFHVQLYTTRHHVCVLFLQAGRGTVITSSCTTKASLNAGLILVITRHKLWFLDEANGEKTMPSRWFLVNTYLAFMLVTTQVTTADELQQIHDLNQLNLKQNISASERAQEGFVSWLYSIELLQQMHQLAPSIIVKDAGKVVGYALATLPEARMFHHDLEEMFQGLEAVMFKGKSLFSYQFYCMGQICIAKDYRGRGLVKSLYQKHKEVYSPHYNFLLTEISTRNPRSQKAHEKVGFRTIHTHTDTMDEWNVVVWEW